MLENKKRVLVIIIALLVGNLFFGFNYFKNTRELKTLQQEQTKIEVNEKTVNFAALFIKKVLQAETEVDFETRLSLENAVRTLNDPEIMNEWQNFVGSRTETDAQSSVKKLLGILIDKIQK